MCVSKSIPVDRKPMILPLKVMKAAMKSAMKSPMKSPMKAPMKSPMKSPATKSVPVVITQLCATSAGLNPFIGTDVF